MSLHGMMAITLGVPDVEAVAPFYREFGLGGDGDAFCSTAGGEQLTLVQRPWRQLVDVTLGADSLDDLERIKADAAKHGAEVAEHNGTITIVEPTMRLPIHVAVMPRIAPEAVQPAPVNVPGNTGRPNERPATLFEDGPAQPRRLGHVAVGTPDIAATSQFLQTVLGFKLSDRVDGAVEFVRCSTDHHNFALAAAPVPFLHHSSWQLDSMDAIGHGATHLLKGDPDRHAWGLGRHFIGSNLFWYFRDPAGNFAEYFSDIDQIVDDAEWMARTWEPDKALYIWGHPTPDALAPTDLGEIVEAMASAS